MELAFCVASVCLTILYGQHAHYKATKLRTNELTPQPDKELEEIKTQLKELKSSITVLNMKEGFKR